jgi:hypothetical protein
MYSPSQTLITELKRFSHEYELTQLGYEIFWNARAIMLFIESKSDSPLDMWKRYETRLDLNLFMLLCFSIATKLEHYLLPPFLGLKIDYFSPSEVFAEECSILEQLDWRPRFRCPFCLLGPSQSDLELSDLELDGCRRNVVTRVSSTFSLLDCRTTSHEIAAAAAVSQRRPVEDELVTILDLLVSEVCLRANDVYDPCVFRVDRAVDALSGMRSVHDVACSALRSSRRAEIETQRKTKRKYASPTTVPRYRPAELVLPEGEYDLDTPSPYRKRR